MASSGFRSDDEDKVDSLLKWPLEYVGRTKEYNCGWCGQALDHTADDLEVHFKNCKNSKEKGFLMVLNDLRKMKRKYDVLKAEMDQMKKTKAEAIEEIKTEIRKELEINKSEFEKKIADLKAEVKKHSETEIKNKFGILKEEMGVAQEVKMAEVNGRVSGVVETMSTVVRSVLEAKGSSSADHDSSFSNIESNNVNKSEDDIQIIKIRLKNPPAEAEPNDGGHRHVKRQLEDEETQQLARKKIKKSFLRETSPSDQSTIPMNCFNLATHNYLFRPSFRWTIDDIEALTARKTFEMSSEQFQWNGYPVQARANLELKENNRFYLSLSLNDVSKESELEGSRPIPQVFYLLKDESERNPRHACESVFYLSGSEFHSSLAFDASFGHKSWLTRSRYNVDDAVEIEVYVEPPSMTRYVHSYNGILEWNIENYKRRLMLEREVCVPYHESPYFYTGPRGYRVQVRVELNGIREGGGPSARVLFLSGQFDDQLSESFPHTTTLTLFNRKNPERNVNTVVEGDINEECEFEMCKLEEVQDLLENDTLSCRVSITSR